MAEKRKSHEGKTAAGKTSSQPSASIQVPIEWRQGSDIISRYANHVVAQLGEKECYVSFFEIRPPFVLGTQEQMESQAKELKSVPADCVARIVISHDVLPSVIEVFQTIWNTRQQKLAAKNEETSGGDNGKKKAAES
jgi:hypothetical protein